MTHFFTLKEISLKDMMNIRAKANRAIGLPRRDCSKSKVYAFPAKTEENQKALDRKAAYKSWVNEHPSARHTFDQMMEPAKGKRIVVFLDYDGTLSPIVNDPDRAFMSDAMRSAVREVSKHFPTAIISGRSRDKVKMFVKLDNVYYAGSHGMDIVGPGKPPTFDGKHCPLALDRKGNEGSFQPAKEFLPTIQEIFTTLEEIIGKIEGARVEDNRFCLSVHFRQVRKEDCGILEEKVISLLKKYPKFRLTRGRKVMEIRPCIEWNKGHALEYLLENLGLGNSSNVFPLYIGDDRTDEDAFKVIERRGQGYPIIVSSVPKDTKAHYSLKDPEEVRKFLSRLARWSKASSGNRIRKKCKLLSRLARWWRKASSGNRIQKKYMFLPPLARCRKASSGNRSSAQIVGVDD